MHGTGIGMDGCYLITYPPRAMSRYCTTKVPEIVEGHRFLHRWTSMDRIGRRRMIDRREQSTAAVELKQQQEEEEVVYHCTVPLECDGEGEAEGGVGGSGDDDDGQRVSAECEQVVGEEDVGGEHALRQQEAADDEHLLHQIDSTLA